MRSMLRMSDDSFVDPEKVSFLGPVMKVYASDSYAFKVVVDGVPCYIECSDKNEAHKDRGVLLLAIKDR